MRSVTAKVRGISQVNPCLGNDMDLRQCSAPLSLRIPSLAALGTISPERDATFSPHTDRLASLTMAPVRFLLHPKTLNPDPSTRASIGSQQIATGSNETWPMLASIPLPATCCLPDLSDHMGVLHPDEGIMMGQFDPDPVTGAGSFNTDLYGWEAGYNRQTDC
ncbi:hypothetical protein GGS21DRAFT_285821 [Xylaria nigripes]|nr:hypothetical protein GGS21DRAFT_285821 [Xylaria nigripes]